MRVCMRGISVVVETHTSQSLTLRNCTLLIHYHSLRGSAALL